MSCATQPVANHKELKIEPNDEGEYDIEVLDPGYDTFLATKAFPESYFTESYLKQRNLVLVNNWNARHSQPRVYNPNIYEVYIDYNPQINYGLNFEWKLFNFFMFVEWQTGERIDGMPPRIR
ncbi:hypothetical protein EDL98_00905 [Ornithobacterium rhinotracheale]|nr:hypothetical protein [Ornithobacterium rhinotracheale]